MTRTESPLAAVIKLISAEALADFDEAKKYIDVNKVYSGNVDTLTPEQAWKDQVMFFYNMSRDKKFTNVFKYYNFNIKEEEKGDNATVVFESIHPEDSISKILYTLDRHNNTWEVVKIEFIKK